MSYLKPLVVVVCCALAATAVAASPAFAQAPTPEVTLKMSRNIVVFGEKVKLSGHIDPRAPGQRVNIVSSDGEVVASDTTDRRGRYSVRIKPNRNMKLRAQWTAVVSKQKKLRVRPRVHAYLGKVRLFNKARVNGRVAPAVEDAKVEIRIVTKDRKIATKRVKLRDGRFFKSKFRVRTVDPMRAKVVFDPKGLARGGDATAYKAPRTPSLAEGSSGRYVKILERRLKSLAYRLGTVDRSFDHTTGDAVLAFHKVQGLPRTASVGDFTWRALLDPKRPKPVAKKGYHFEVDQTKQVLYIVRGGKIRTIVHVSTGANGYTRDGVWTVHRQIAGYSPGRLYHPSYFDGARAVHGWPDVPTYPASHGCVRTPMWIAPWLREKTHIGMTVRIYHS